MQRAAGSTGAGSSVRRVCWSRTRCGKRITFHMHPPKQSEVIEKLTMLLRGDISRKEASEWAAQWVLLDNPPEMDDSTWDALGNMAGTDMPTTDRPYLFGNDDFSEWLNDLQSAKDKFHTEMTMNDQRILSAPPALNPEIGEAKSCILFDNHKFTVLMNKAAWFDFRSSLWSMATSLSPGEDISVSSDGFCKATNEAVVVRYCEITLIPGDQPAGRFLKVKNNFLYRPQDRRVDFSVVRPEAVEAFLASESLEAESRRIMLFHNLWLEVTSDLQ